MPRLGCGWHSFYTTLCFARAEATSMMSVKKLMTSSRTSINKEKETDMKRALYILSAALMVFASSCSKDEQPVNNYDVKMVQATINAESSNTGDGTKTIATKEGEVYKITWEAGDELSVFSTINATTSMTKFVANSNGASTKFTGEIEKGSTIDYAILPYDAKASVSGTTVKTNIPAEQNGDFYNIVLAGWPKDQTRAEGAEYNFNYQFEAVCGILKFHFDPSKFTGKLAEGEKIVSVKIVADRPIVGEAQISYEGVGTVEDKKPVMTAGTNVSNTVSLVSPDGLEEGDYYFATLPILTSEVPTMGISVSIETNKHNTASVRASLPGSGKTTIFTANTVKNIGTINFKGFDPHPFSSGNFTTKATRTWVSGVGNVWTFTKISFSRGNLQYQGSTKKWRFAINQWDVQGNVGNSTVPEATEKVYISEGPRATQSEWIDLFPWGHTGWNDGDRTYEPSKCTSVEADFYYKYHNNAALNGTPGDWGYQNAIMNGDTEDHAGTWRVFKQTELDYILFTRGTEAYQEYMTEYTFDVDVPGKKTAQLRFLRCGIKNTGLVQYGLLIFPDGFEWPSDLAVPIRKETISGNKSLAFNDKFIRDSEAPVYDMSIFSSKLAGCVFLPSAGYRLSFTPGSLTSLCPQDVNIGGKYWSQSKEGTTEHLAIYSQNISWEGRSGWVGCSVRLVKDVPVE